MNFLPEKYDSMVWPRTGLNEWLGENNRRRRVVGDGGGPLLPWEIVGGSDGDTDSWRRTDGERKHDGIYKIGRAARYLWNNNRTGGLLSSSVLLLSITVRRFNCPGRFGSRRSDTTRGSGNRFSLRIYFYCSILLPVPHSRSRRLVRVVVRTFNGKEPFKKNK